MIVLASASPRRHEIMKLMGLDFTVVPAKDEKNPEGVDSPGEYTALSALYKAENVAGQFGDKDVVIGADTVVSFENKILGKPRDREDAFRMLRMLAGNVHTVYTGYAIIKGEKKVTGSEKTEVEFRSMTDDEIYDYIDTGEPMDKAGAYGIQGLGCVNIRRINGDYFNVMGLPACTLYRELREGGFIDG